MNRENQVEIFISFSSIRDNISLVEKFVNDTCEQIKISEEHYGNILIALTEAVSNAIIHGNKLDETKNVSLGINSQESKNICFYVEDEGSGFDYNNLPDPTDPKNIENPDGRGVFLMKNLTDDISFNDSGNRVELTFNI